MKLIYGKGNCNLDSIVEPINSIIIKYRGNIVLRHNFAELINVTDNNQYFRNLYTKSILIHGNNQIHIGFLEPLTEINKLFEYVGEFKIMSAKINNININFETKGVDFYELINSKWDNMGKPEIYKDSYQIGKVSKNRNKSRLSNQKPIKLNGGGY